MITRLQISGFKNLVDVDVQFGPLTCIAGANGVGKSNLFDALHFLSLLADQNVAHAAYAIRNEEEAPAGTLNLFFRSGTTQAKVMTFIVEMLVPKRISGDQDIIIPSVTTLRYTLTLADRQKRDPEAIGRPFEIVFEELVPIRADDQAALLLFPHASVWSDGTLHPALELEDTPNGRRFTEAYLSTVQQGNTSVITLHTEHPAGSSGKTADAAALSRTLLSTADATISPTAFAARQEMRSWRLLHLDPAALRKPDAFRDADQSLGMHGEHLPALLYRLASQRGEPHEQAPSGDPTHFYEQIAGRLREVSRDIRSLHMDIDPGRALLTIMIDERHDLSFTAQSLSDGAIRFLALAALEQDNEPRLWCIEEPENGLHPDHIPALLDLLRSIAVDPHYPDDPVDNPLRQIIVTTHSPLVVSYAPSDTLLFAQPTAHGRGKQRTEVVTFRWLPETWRAQSDSHRLIAPGDIFIYRHPTTPGKSNPNEPDVRMIDCTDSLMLPAQE